MPDQESVGLGYQPLVVRALDPEGVTMKREPREMTTRMKVAFVAVSFVAGLILTFAFGKH